MTTISAKIVAHSVSPGGHHLASLQLRFPRFILAELNTHRQFSRNSRSSRAIPVEKMIQEVIDDPVIPIHWGAAQPGMQAYQECSELIRLKPDEVWTNKEAWLAARDRVVEIARAFHKAGYHKQVINRLLEPWMHIDTLVSATDWSNFFALRIHHAAEPHMQMLARCMKDAKDQSTPRHLEPGDWHLPYITDEERMLFSNKDDLIKISVARCARISYAPFDGDASYEREFERYKLLVGSAPIHASPAEHQGTPDSWRLVDTLVGKLPEYENRHEWGNFTGWRQFRKMLPNECL